MKDFKQNLFDYNDYLCFEIQFPFIKELFIGSVKWKQK